MPQSIAVFPPKSRLALLLCALAGLPLTGCVSWYKGDTQTSEALLAAAGFHLYYPQDAQEKANLKTIPQRQLLKVPAASQPTYLYADDRDCDCIFVGNAAALAQLKQYTLTKHQADVQFKADEYRENYVLSPRIGLLGNGMGTGGGGPWASGMW